jgi:hypothetical protein
MPRRATIVAREIVMAVSWDGSETMSLKKDLGFPTLKIA